jgi:hypothetical protein
MFEVMNRPGPGIRHRHHYLEGLDSQKAEKSSIPTKQW